MKVRTVILLYSNISSEVNQSPSVLHFNIVSVLNTLYIHFCVVVAGPIHSFFTELSAYCNSVSIV